MVWGICMVKDEADVIAHTLDHYESEGLDGIAIADNASIDGTRDLIRAFARRASVQVIALDDQDVANHQARAMTGLARLAARSGADWIVPFDADEIYAHPRMRLADALRAMPDSVRVISTPPYNYVATYMDDQGEPNPFLRMQWREQVRPTRRGNPKVCLRFSHDLTLARGQHFVWRGDDEVPDEPSDVELYHFQWRSLEQMARKMLNLHRSYVLAGHPEDGGLSARYGPLLERGLGADDAWREVRIARTLERAPAPWRRWWSA